MNLKDANEVNHTIREILDARKFKGQPLSELSRKKYANVVSILIVYTRFAELRLNQLYHIISEMNKAKEEDTHEPERETEITP